jgi:hypothetical protein
LRVSGTGYGGEEKYLNVPAENSNPAVNHVTRHNLFLKKKEKLKKKESGTFRPVV